MEKSELLQKFLYWNYPKYNRTNPPRWLNDPALEDLYEYTRGPFNSPDPVECFVLYELAKNCNHDILEIGSWRGRTSCFLAQGIKDSTNPNRRLHCIDWFKGDNTGGADPNYEDMFRSLCFFSLDKYTSIYSEDMLTFNYNRLFQSVLIDFVFYDSDHSVDPTVATLARVHDSIEDDSIVCMHDSKWESSRSAIKRLEHLYSEYVTLNVWEGTTILCKK